ncbi:MAG: putative rane protein [Anaerocolumna sp.]|jgi:competence protein ComEC|nr:putative rane protein [Anaerocolumna sp.]
MNTKRPLIWLLASYLAGIGVFQLPLPLVYGGSISLLIVVLWWLFQKKAPKQRFYNYYFLLLLPFLFVTGYLLMNHQIKVPPGDNRFTIKTNAVAEGVISLVEENDNYTRITLKNSKLELEDNNYTNLKLLVYAEEGKPYIIGNKVYVTGTVIKFTKASNPGQFNEYLYYKSKKYDYKFYADSAVITDTRTSSYYQTLYTIRKQLTGIYYKLLPEKNAGVLTAMMLGDTSYLEEDIKELYRENGISHILAISGLHISLLGLTLYKIFRKLHMPLFLATAITLFFLYSYGILTGFSVSTNRAVVMMTVYMAAVLAGRTYDLLSGTAASALIILLRSPLDITSAGFLLSFGAVIGIGTVYPALSKALLKEKKNEQKRISPNMKMSSRESLKRIYEETMVYLWNNILIQTLLSSLSAQLILLPVLLWFFYEIPVYSPLVNLLIIPVSSLLTILAFLAVLIGCVSIPAGVFLMGGVNYILVFYEAVCRLGANLPGKSILTGRPGILTIASFLILLILFTRCNKQKGRRISLFLMIPMLLIFIPHPVNNLQVTFLDVGQGDGIVMQLPGKTTLMIDGGSSSVKKLSKYRLEPFLKYKGIRIIDYAIVTHGDADHYSGVLEFLEEDYKGSVRIKNLLLPGVDLKDETYTNLIKKARALGVRVSVLNTGDALSLEDVSIKCLWPGNDFESGTDKNSHSIVLSLKYGEFDMLLTGDLEGEGEERIIEQITQSGSMVTALNGYEVLKVAHHGSKYSTSSEFLKAVSPLYSIISCGIDNSYGHPHEETVTRLLESGSQILKTTESGAVTIITDGKSMKMEEWLR